MKIQQFREPQFDSQDAELDERQDSPAPVPGFRVAPIHPAEEQGGDEGSATPSQPAKRSQRRLIFLTGGIMLSIAVGLYYYDYVAPYETTDDAFIEAHVTPIAPQVSGRVAKVVVVDNQAVQKGDVLVQIDPSDYEASLDQARANLAAAQSRLEQANAQAAADQAKVEQEKANVVAAEAEAGRATADLKRYQSVGNLGVSDSQLDLAATQARSAAAPSMPPATSSSQPKPRALWIAPAFKPPPPKFAATRPPSGRRNWIFPTPSSGRPKAGT